MSVTDRIWTAVKDNGTGGRRAGFLLALAILATLAGGWSWAPPAHAADEPTGAARVAAYLRGLTSLQARFEQFSFNAERSQMKTSRGIFYLLRPGRFRWEYESPASQVIVADGSRVYVHDLELKQVSHQSQARALRGTPALLLADDAPIETQFEVREIPSTDGRAWVELIPRDPESDVTRIELGFGRTDRLESLIMEDGFGQNTRLNFSQVVRNPTLDPGLFRMEQGAMDDFLSFD